MTKKRLDEIALIKQTIQDAMKGKEFKNLNTGDKDLLLETMARMLGLIK